MADTNVVPSLHEDHELFQAAIVFTSAQTGFAQRLIEKDYYCSILLEYHGDRNRNMVFRGGTCLTKVYAGFYRLSEDLDFLISVPLDSRRAERQSQAEEVRSVVEDLHQVLPVFHIVEGLTGANVSTQYRAVVAYTSIVSGQEETVKIELGLREPLLLGAAVGAASAILLDPVSGDPYLNPIPVRSLEKQEAYAEKLRAAMTRRDVAIRDFYDIDHAVRRMDVRLDDLQLLDLVRRKVAVPGTGPVNVSESRLASLRLQLEPQLRPVLREVDFADFDLDRAFTSVSSAAAQIEQQ